MIFLDRIIYGGAVIASLYNTYQLMDVSVLGMFGWVLVAFYYLIEFIKSIYINIDE